MIVPIEPPFVAAFSWTLNGAGEAERWCVDPGSSVASAGAAHVATLSKRPLADAAPLLLSLRVTREICAEDGLEASDTNGRLLTGVEFDPPEISPILRQAPCPLRLDPEHVPRGAATDAWTQLS